MTTIDNCAMAFNLIFACTVYIIITVHSSVFVLHSTHLH